MAQAAATIALAPAAVVSGAEIRANLKRVLLFAAGSAFPHFDAAHEDNFHESLMWGGPSARTSAAQGLISLVRADKVVDDELLEAIHVLARDPVCHVRLQIIQNLFLLNNIDADWMWSEIEYVVAQEATRGVVTGALSAVSHIAHLDLARTIKVAKATLLRYADQSGPGMQSCCGLAATIIADIHIMHNNAEADDFFAEELRDITLIADQAKQWIARYSDKLLVGSSTDEQDDQHKTRLKTLKFYNEVADKAFAEIDRLSGQLDTQKFASWNAQDQEAIRTMFSVLDEITMRLYFASGARNGETIVEPTVSEDRKRFYREARPLLERLSNVAVVHLAHYLIQTLEALIPIDPAGVFALIARSVTSSEQGGYGQEQMAAELVVRIVERYLGDHREVFANPDRLRDLMDCLDVFVRAGWPAAQSLTFRLGEIWR